MLLGLIAISAMPSVIVPQQHVSIQLANSGCSLINQMQHFKFKTPYFSIHINNPLIHLIWSHLSPLFSPLCITSAPMLELQLANSIFHIFMHFSYHLYKDLISKYASSLFIQSTT